MALTGLTGGKQSIDGEPQLLPDLPEYYRGKIPPEELARILAAGVIHGRRRRLAFR